jgi:hypothetical protein
MFCRKTCDKISSNLCKLTKQEQKKEYKQVKTSKQLDKDNIKMPTVLLL